MFLRVMRNKQVSSVSLTCLGRDTNRDCLLIKLTKQTLTLLYVTQQYCCSWSAFMKINGRDFNSSSKTRHNYCTGSSRWNLFRRNTLPFKLRRVSGYKNLLARCAEKSFFFVYVSDGEWFLFFYYPARSDSSLVAEIHLEGGFVTWYNRRSYSGNYACSSR